MRRSVLSPSSSDVAEPEMSLADADVQFATPAIVIATIRFLNTQHVHDFAPRAMSATRRRVGVHFHMS
jgi:hypothetical protein